MPGYDGYNPYTSTGTYTGTTGTTKPGTSGGYQHPGTGTGTSGTKTTSGLTGRDAALQSAADESVDAYLRSVALKMQGMDEPPLAIDPETGQAIRSGGFKRDDQGQYYVDPFTGPGDKGALLSDVEKARLDANFLGKGLGSIIAVNKYGEPQFDSSGNVIYTGLGLHLQDQWGKGMNILDKGGLEAGKEFYDTLIDDYWKQRYAFDQRWSGRDDFDQSFYGPEGPTEVSETFSGAPWMQKGLGEILAEGPKGFDEMEGIYDPEFKDREASWLYLTGIPQFSDQTIYDYV